MQTPLADKLYWHEYRWQEAKEDPLVSSISIPPNLQTACASRKRDFLMGRLCALHALQKLCANPTQPQPAVGSNGEPLWGPNVVGSISHTLDSACAVVGLKKHFLGIGVDLQERIHMEKLNDIAKNIASTKERRQKPANLEEADYLTLLFSAKESVYKAYFPLVRQFIDFHDVEIELSKYSQKSFTFHFLKNYSHLNSLTDNVEGYFRFRPRMVQSVVLLAKG